MKNVMTKLLFALLKDSKKSDRQLAKILGVSQATVSRTRSRLVSEGMIKEFTIIPDFVKLGYELMAVSVGRFKTQSSPERIERGKNGRTNIPTLYLRHELKVWARTHW